MFLENDNRVAVFHHGLDGLLGQDLIAIHCGRCDILRLVYILSSKILGRLLARLMMMLEKKKKDRIDGTIEGKGNVAFS